MHVCILARMYLNATYLKADNVNWKVTQPEAIMNFCLDNLRVVKAPNLCFKMKPPHIEHFNMKSDEDLNKTYNWQGEPQPPKYATQRETFCLRLVSLCVECLITQLTKTRGKVHLQKGSIFW